MNASLLLLAGLTIGAEPDKVTLPTRVLSLPTDPAHLRIAGKRLYISGFHSGKLVTVSTRGKGPARELRLDAFETYRTDPKKGEVREIRHAAGGDLVLADGKLFVGQVFQGSLLVVDRATFTPVKRLPLGGEGRLAASKDGKTVYFASNTRPEFHIIDTRTYEHRAVAYPPGGHGIGCLAVSPDGQRLYLGIQRGGRMRDGRQLSGGNSFLAVYDLAKQDYCGTVFLAQKRPDGSGDDGLPTSFAFSPDGKGLYIGTFQSEAGVLVVDTQKLELLNNLYFGSKHQNPAFPWVDPLSVAVHDRWLLVAVRHNQEVAAVDLASHKVVAKITHSEPVGLEHVVVRGKRIYLFAESSAVSIVKGADLSRLLAGINLAKTGPVQVTLMKR
jgi:DNA-binding beta-propeller fold protein YncE